MAFALRSAPAAKDSHELKAVLSAQDAEIHALKAQLAEAQRASSRLKVQLRDLDAELQVANEATSTAAARLKDHANRQGMLLSAGLERSGLQRAHLEEELQRMERLLWERDQETARLRKQAQSLESSQLQLDMEMRGLQAARDNSALEAKELSGSIAELLHQRLQKVEKSKDVVDALGASPFSIDGAASQKESKRLHDVTQVLETKRQEFAELKHKTEQAIQFAGYGELTPSVLFEGELTVVRRESAETRHCILSHNVFKYFASDGKPLARFPISSSSSLELIPGGLRLRHGAKVIVLQGPADQVALWRQHLELAFQKASKASLELRIFSPSGQHLCTVLAEHAWRARDMKAIIKSATGISPVEQRLVYGLQVLEDQDVLEGVLPLQDGSSHDLSLVRCPPPAEMEHPGLRLDRASALRAVRGDWRQLGQVDAAYRQDREIVMMAVAQDCMALQYAADFLRADREVILAAVHQCGSSIQFASSALREDPEILLLTLAYWPDALNCEKATAVSKWWDPQKQRGAWRAMDRRVTIVTEGSRGDWQPSVAAGAALRQAGFQVQLLGSADVKAMAQQYDLFFVETWPISSKDYSTQPKQVEAITENNFVKLTAAAAAIREPMHELVLTRTVEALKTFKPDVAWMPWLHPANSSMFSHDRPRNARCWFHF
ncbi:unnamed protein product [Effrenium voratum]|nr:unnamed protein product [Effrenium voratum]